MAYCKLDIWFAMLWKNKEDPFEKNLSRTLIESRTIVRKGVPAPLLFKAPTP